MKSISDVELFEYFKETLEHCGTFLLDMGTEDIEWHLFEEFDGESTSFLHEKALDRLLAFGHISTEVYTLCQVLRKQYRNLEVTSLWNPEAVKTTAEWYEVLALADKIRCMI